MTEIKQPKIRFKGHINDWEQRKLGQLAIFNPKAILPNNFEYVDLESVVGIDMVNHRTETKETAPSRAQRLAVRGDVFYQTVRPYQKNNYLFELPFDNYVFSTGYAQLRPFGDSYFLLTRLQGERFVSNVLDRSTGTSYPAINVSDLAEIEVPITINIEEQKLIGNFFRNLDNTIALHQQKLEVTKQFKQTMLKKMFPKNGETTPEIRFKGFTDDWCVFKVGDIFNNVILSGNRLPKDSLVVGDIPYVIAKSENNGVFKHISKDTLDFNGNIMKLFNKNSITLSIDNPEAIFVQKENFYTSNIMRVLYNEELTYEHHLIISEKIKEKTRGFGWGLKFSGPIIMNTELILPTDGSKNIGIYELQIIGKLFKDIDSQIINLENKIKTIKTLKATLLSKIFI